MRPAAPPHDTLRLVLCAALIGCGGDDGGALAPDRCEPGTTQACACPDGREAERVCRDDGGYGACTCLPATLTIAGVARPSFTVEVLAPAPMASVTADGDGRYAVTVTGLAPDAVLSLRARGRPATGETHVELFSVLDSFDALRGRADGSPLEATTYAGTRLDGFSTVRAAALADANGGPIPATRRALLDAEVRLDQTLRATTLIEAALLLDRFDADQRPPPGYETTWALAKDLAGLQATLRALAPAPLDPQGPLGGAARSWVDAAPVAPFDPTGAELFGPLRRRRADGTGPAADRYIFETPTRVRFQASTADGGVQPERRLEWRVTDRGFSVVPRGSVRRVSLTEDEVVQLLDRPDLEAEVRAALGGSRLTVERRLASNTYRRIGEGIRVQWLAKLDDLVWGLNVALRDFGFDVGPVEQSVLVGGELWHARAAFEPLALPAARLTRAPWAMRVLARARNPAAQNTYDASDLIFVPAIVTFAEDGSGLATSSALTRPAPFQWRRLDGERIRLDFDAGTPQVATLVEDTGRETGWLHEHGLGPSARVSYGRDVPVDVGLELDAAALVNAPGTYWQSTADWAAHDFDGEGQLQPREVSGFRFEPDGAADLLQYVSSTDSVQVVQDFIEYAVVEGEVRIETFFGSDGNIGRCTARDGSCVAIRSQRWRPVARRGEYLYVIESRTLLGGQAELFRGELRWDASTGQWLDPLGARLPLDVKVDLIAPRLNAYRIRPLP